MNAENFFLNINYTNSNNNSMNPFLNQNNTIIKSNIMNNNNFIQNNQMNNIPNFNQLNNNQIFNSNNLRNKIQQNNSEMKLDNFWIDINQIGILFSILDFYKKTENDDVDINKKVQIMNIINRLNPDISSLKKENEILDPLYYVHEPKKLINFINSDFNLFTVKVPNSLTKLDLYSIARLYKYRKKSEILLIHKNYIIDEDESSIDFITQNDYVIIIENRTYPDSSFYESLIKNNPCTDSTYMISVNVASDKRVKYFEFPSNITIFQMKKALNLEFGFCKRDKIFWMEDNENKYLKEIFIKPEGNYIRYEEAKCCYNNVFYGKIINVEIEFIKNAKHFKFIVVIGQLDSNKILVEKIQNLSLYKVKKIIYDNKTLNIKDEMSIKSLGIKNGSVCFVEFQ